MELIVVSDGCTDSTSSTVAGFTDRLPLKFLRQSKSGVASARNLALTETRSPLVLFLDDDVVPSPGLIEKHLQFHEEHPEVESALLGYVTWLPELPITPFMKWYGEFGALYGFARLASGHEVHPRYLYSCNISFKTEFLRSNGGFDPHLSVLEDNELGFRLGKQGMRLFFCRAARGYHNQAFTFQQACQRLERYSVGIKPFLSTDAGREMMRRRGRVSFRLANAFVKIIGPWLSPFRPMLDSGIGLPNAVYRLFYWYYGSYLSFWSRTTQK